MKEQDKYKEIKEQQRIAKIPKRKRIQSARPRETIIDEELKQKIPGKHHFDITKLIL